MAFDFPAAPTEGQTFSPAGGPAYIYRAPAWELLNTTSGSAVTPSSTSPAMDGVAAAGSSLLYSRGDHVHPSNTAHVLKAGDRMTGALQVLAADLPGPLHTTQIITDRVCADNIAGNLWLKSDGATWAAKIAGWASNYNFGAGDGSYRWYVSNASLAVGAAPTWINIATLDRAGNFNTTAGLFAVNCTLTGTLTSPNISMAGVGPIININKTSAAHAGIQMLTNSSVRWLASMSDSTAEAAGNVGSDFSIYRYDNTGAYVGMPLRIVRSSGDATFSNNLTAGGGMWAGGYTAQSGYYQSARGDGNLFLGANGAHIYFRPYGWSSGTTQGYYQNDGTLYVPTNFLAPYHTSQAWVYGGWKCKNGGSGDNGGNVFNCLWDSVGMLGFVDNVNLGYLNNGVSDYRIKKDVEELPNMWETVKALRPIKYTQAEFQTVMSDEVKARLAAQAVKEAANRAEIRKIAEDEGRPEPEFEEAKPAPGPIFLADDTERWGFIAHELQETLVPSAASGVKDMEDGVQSLNPWTIIAALTKTIQEMQLRIEALEATNGV